MRIRVLVSFSFLLFVIASASGQELIMGWEGGPSNGYGFAMPVFRLPKDGTNSLVIRPSGSYLYYNFPEAGGFTTVSSPGAAFGLAYRLHTQRVTFTLARELRRAGTTGAEPMARRQTRHNSGSRRREIFFFNPVRSQVSL